jgi:hypothetical protein
MRKQHLTLVSSNDKPKSFNPIRGHLNLISVDGVIVNEEIFNKLTKFSFMVEKIANASVEELSVITLQIDKSDLSEEEKLRLLKQIYEARLIKTGRMIRLIPAPAPKRKKA